MKLQISYVVLLIAASIAALPPAHAADKDESNPAILQPPSGEKLTLRAHASGWQIYTSSNAPAGSPKWTLKAPDADLLDRKGKIVGHHSAGLVWKYKDGSEVTAKTTTQKKTPDEK